MILSLLFFKLGDELVFHEEEIEVEKQLVPGHRRESGQDLAIPKAAAGLLARRYMPRKKVFVFLCDSIYCVLPFFLAISGTKSAPRGRQEAMQRALPACACGSYATAA